jgi:hypothetical protein
MSSEHEVLFSSLSLNYKNNIKKILEIGTFDGKNSFFYYCYYSKIQKLILKKIILILKILIIEKKNLIFC